MGIRLLRKRTPTGVRHGSDDRVEGTARLDHRTKNLVGRLKPGNIAVIDHDDLDRVAAESLVEHGVAAVINARRSISGRYPNLGPLVLVHAGVPVLDDVGVGVFEHIVEGEPVRIEGDAVYVADRLVARGTILDEAGVRERMDAARAQLSEVVERFAENTLEYVRREQDILLEGVRLPELRTDFRGRHALVVTRGYHYKEDLNALGSYIREMRPVVIAVDGAADACIDAGVRPDLIVGDMDSVSTTALRCGAELVVHPMGDWRRAHANGEAQGPPPNAAAVEALGLDYRIITAPGMSEDVGMLLAHEKGAELIVTVGSHTSLVEFLDKGRSGMASTFLTRLRLGPVLVDAKGVSRLYRTRIRTRDLILMIGAAVTTLGIANGISPGLRRYWTSLGGSLWRQLQGLF